MVKVGDPHRFGRHMMMTGLSRGREQTLAEPMAPGAPEAGSPAIGALDRRSRLDNLIIVGPTLAFFLVPLLGWTGPFGMKMNLSGDGSLLYFEYPAQWIHASTGALSNTVSGYNPQVQFVPFVALLDALRSVGLNAEGFVFGSVLALAYFGTASLVCLIHGSWGTRTKLAGALAGVIMVCAPLLADGQWTAILPEIEWIGLLPILLVLFVTHQQRGGHWRPLAAALIFAVAAPGITDLPGFLPVALVAVGVVIVLVIGGTAPFIVKRAAGFVALLVGASAYWVVPWLIGGFLFHNVTFGYATSAAVRSSSASTLIDLARQSSVRDTIGLRASMPMAVENAWPQLPEMRWSQGLSVIGDIPILLVFAGILRVIVAPRQGGPVRHAVLLVLLSALLAELLTLGVIPGAPQAYAAVVDSIPGLTSLRTFYVVWIIPFAFVAALTVGVWSALLFEVLRLRKVAAVAAVGFVAMILYDAPFLGGSIFYQPHSATAPSTKVISGLSSSYMAVIDRLQHLPSGGVLTLPLRSTAWSFVPSSHRDLTGGAYLGTSPIYALTGRSEFDGTDSFSNPYDAELPNAIGNDVANQDLEGLARAAGAVGVRYVLIDTAALHHVQEMTPLIAPAFQESVEFTRFVQRFAPKVLLHSGAYELRALARQYVQPRAMEVTSTSADLKPGYVSSTALSLRPQGITMCSGAGTIQVLDWSRQAAVLRVGSVPAGCLLWVGVHAAPGWQATVLPADHGKRYSRAPAAANASGIGFRLKASSGPVLVRVTYPPEALIWLGGLCSGITLAIGLLLFACRAGGASKRHGGSSSSLTTGSREVEVA